MRLYKNHFNIVLLAASILEKMESKNNAIKKLRNLNLESVKINGYLGNEYICIRLAKSNGDFTFALDEVRESHA